MNKLFLLLTIVMVSFSAQGEGLTINVGLSTNHIIIDKANEMQIAKCERAHTKCYIKSFNENNQLIGFGYNNYQVFTMTNSYSIRSYGIMKTFNSKYIHGRIGLQAGISCLG